MTRNLALAGPCNSLLLMLVISVGSGIRVHGEQRIEFIAVEPGEFLMGCRSQDADCGDDERPAHSVRISAGFEIGKYEITQAQWTEVMGTNPSRFRGPALPVESVSWNEARRFIAKLNRARGPYRYRLPTEAEWEYAARAGYSGPPLEALDDIAWHGANSADRTHEVGTKRPNAWGIHDMLGNVWEWCSDRYGADFYSASPDSDPRGPSEGAFRVMRGGSWYRYMWFVRFSARFRDWPDAAYRHVGLRCVRTKK